MVDVVIWILIWAVIIFAVLAVLVMIFLGSWLAASWIVTRLYAKRILGCSAEFPQFFPQVKPEKLPQTYREKLDAAWKFFRMRPNVPIVQYRFLPGVRIASAYCTYTSVPTIVFSEAFLQLADEHELAGILAHEFAHLEYMIRTDGYDQRHHWMVDQRAEELASTEAIHNGLCKWISINESVRKRHPVLIFLRIMLTAGGDRECPRPPHYYDTPKRIAILADPTLRQKLSA